MAERPDTQESPPPSPTEDEEKAELFAPVLAALEVDKLPSLARTLLQAQQSDDAPLPSVDDPIYGSYHVIFPLRFENGPRWVVKIPIDGVEGKWNELSSSSLTSEAETMHLLRRETTIPIPDVFDFSSTTENPLHCPYIIMSFIPGVSLYDIWFGHRVRGSSREETHSHRLRALEDIALAMSQLGKFSFRSGGQPRFSGAGGGVSGMGVSRKIDNKAMLDRWFVHNDPDDDPMYVEIEPYCDPRRHYTTMLDLYPEDAPIPRGLQLLLRQLIDWIPDSTDQDPFVLSHPDFDIQNFIVTDSGELTGIIDWDGVSAVPRSIGNERYPGWLTRDWDPAMYGYKDSMEEAEETEGLWEDSPKTLAEYRGIYDGLVAGRREEGRQNFCRMSLITDNLAIAAHDPGCRNSILQKMVEEIWAANGKEGPGFTELAAIFVEGNVDDGLMGDLKAGFDILLSKEGL